MLDDLPEEERLIHDTVDRAEEICSESSPISCGVVRGYEAVDGSLGTGRGRTQGGRGITIVNEAGCDFLQ